MAEPAADATVANATALYSQLATWETEGPTATKIVDLEDGSYGSLSLANYDMDFTVTIRSQNYDTLGAKFTSIDFDTSRNLKVQFMETNISGVAGNCVSMNAGNTCGLEYCKVGADKTADAGFGTNVKVGNYGIHFSNNSQNCYVRDCYIDGGWTKGIAIISGDDGWEVSGCVFNDISTDDIIVSSATTGLISRNWFSRTRYPESGDHCDMCQLAGPQTHSDITIYGNVGMKAHLAVTTVVQPNLVRGTSTDITIQQNIYASNWSGGIKLSHDNSTDFLTDAVCDHNTSLRVTDDNTSTQYTASISAEGGTHTSSNNVSAVNTGSSTLGTGSISIDVGNSYANRDYTDQETYYHGPITNSPSFGFYDMRPKDGQDTHWDATTPKGAAVRFKEVLVDGVHPGNSKGPVVAAWQAQYDPGNQISASATPQVYSFAGGLLMINGLVLKA